MVGGVGRSLFLAQFKISKTIWCFVIHAYTFFFIIQLFIIMHFVDPYIVHET
jgi:hypothetical protein